MKSLISLLFFILCTHTHAQAYSSIAGYKTLNNFTEPSVNFEPDVLTVVLFISNECPCSNSHLDHLKELTRQYSAVSFVAVHTGEHRNISTIEEYYRSKNLNFAVLADSEQKLIREFKALRTPQAFLIKGQSVLYSGGLSDDAHFPAAKKHYLKEALQEAIQNKPITSPHSKLNGCYIERI